MSYVTTKVGRCVNFKNTDNIFTINAIVSLLVANMAKKAPKIWNNGAPGGWPTSSFAAVEIYSPQSQKLIVGSTVREYVIKAIVNVVHPKMVFHLLKLKFIIYYEMKGFYFNGTKKLFFLTQLNGHEQIFLQ